MRRAAARSAPLVAAQIIASRRARSNSPRKRHIRLRQPRLAVLIHAHPAIETRAAAGVAAIAVAGDADAHFDGVLVAIDAHFLDALDLAAGGALVPEFVARAGPVMRLAGLEGFGERLCVHMGDHEDTLGIGIHRHRRDQALGVEAGGEDLTLFLCGFVEVLAETRFAHAGFHPFPYEQRRPARRRSAFTKGKSRHKSTAARQSSYASAV